MSHPEAPGPGPDREAPPSRSELRLWETALRQDWPIPPKVKQRILQVALNLVDPDEDATPPVDDPDAWVRRDRSAVAAMRVLAQFGRLSIEQQKLDLAREKHAIDTSAVSATDGAGGVDPAAAERALRALVLEQDDDHDEPITRPDPEHPAGDP